MSARARVDCIAPRLLGPVPETLASAVASAGPFPATEWLLTRGRQQPSPGDDAESILRGLRPELPASGSLVAAAHEMAGDAKLYCFRASAVHLQPDRDRLLLFAGNSMQPSEEEARTLTEHFNRNFDSDGLTLLWQEGDWLLLCDQPPGPDLPSLSRVAGRYLDTVLPAEEASRRWRQLLNEVQMLLHDHPVNTQREQRGEPTLNGLWFWGGGPLSETSLPPQPVVGKDSLSHGLARLGGTVAQGVETLRASNEQRVSQQIASEDSLVIWLDAETAMLGGDAQGWLEALQRFEQEVAQPLWTPVKAGDIELCIHDGAGRVHKADAWAQWRFWRRPRELANFMARE